MFEKNTWIRTIRNVIVGSGVICQLSDAILELPLNGQPLVVTSPSPWGVAGDIITEQLSVVGPAPSIEVFDTADFRAVEHVVESAGSTNAEYLIGVGGGKAIDIAKLAAANLDLEFVSVPTAASHDGIVSGRGSIPEGDTRHSVAAKPPVAVVADTAVIANSPWRLTTAGCADVISNYTAVRDWELAQRLHNVSYSQYAGALARMTAEMLVENADSIRPDLEESVWVVIKALVSSGVAMSIAGSSRPASGAEHLFSHQLDRLVPGAALHGHQVGIGSILTAYLQRGDDWQRVRDALERIGAPTTAKEIGIDEQTIIQALTTAHEIRERYTILGNGIDAAAAREAVSITGVT